MNSNQIPLDQPWKDLNSVREEITKLHQDVLIHLEAALHKGIRIGGKLAGLQSQLKHSRNYENWINANLPFSTRTARDYVSLYKNRELIEHESDADRLSIRAALKLISDTAKAVTPLETPICLLDVEPIKEEEDFVKLADRELLLIEAEPGFINEIVILIRRANMAGRRNIKFQRKSVFDT